MPDNKQNSIQSIIGRTVSNGIKSKLKTSAKAALVGIAVKAITNKDTLGIGKMSGEAIDYVKKQDLGTKFSSLIQKGKEMINGPEPEPKVTFVDFVNEFSNNKLYKDQYADCGIIAFIGSQSGKGDIVVGHHKQWEQVIQHARLMNQSSLDKKVSQKITQKLVETMFGREMAQSYGEHFEIDVKKPVVKTVAVKKPAVKRVSAVKPVTKPAMKPVAKSAKTLEDKIASNKIAKVPAPKPRKP